MQETVERTWKTLSRDCNALLVPSATPVLLMKGEEVQIVQALGDTYTVNVRGNLARIDNCDADALGFECNPSIQESIAVDGKVDIDTVWRVLKTCYDPEIPVNIVDLGLIYACELQAIEGLEGEHYRVDIKMTLTAVGCGMGPVLVADVENRLQRVATIDEVMVELVFDPPWNQGMMSEAAKLQLGMF